MASPSGEKAQIAGDSVDLAALIAQLREEIRRTGPRRGGNGGASSARLNARAGAERVWRVSADRPIGGRGGVAGAALRPVKLVVRKLVRWYVEPAFADQRAFNDAILKLVDMLFDEADAARAARARDERMTTELEERLTRAERRDRSPGTVAAQPRAAAVPDYFALESRMRGSVESVRERQRIYVADFRDAGPVLDVGCGRGEFLMLLRDAGIEARGVDADGDMVAFARGEGLEVEQADVLAYLEGVEDGSLGGIFAAQVVEHLPPPTLLRFLELAHAKLRSGGLLVAETINPLSPLALRNYFADLTHAQPLVPETLELLARQSGLRVAETRFLNEPEKLVAPDDPVLAANVARLNEILFGPQDYAILARR